MRTNFPNGVLRCLRRPGRRRLGAADDNDRLAERHFGQARLDDYLFEVQTITRKYVPFAMPDHTFVVEMNSWQRHNAVINGRTSSFKKDSATRRERQNRHGACR